MNNNNKFIRFGFIILVLVIAAVPRLMDLSRPSLTYDETVDYYNSLLTSERMPMAEPALGDYINGQLPQTISSSFYKLFGYDEVVARFLSVLMSLLAIFVAFLISKRLFGYWWGILTMSMLSLSPFYISASRLAFSHGHGFSLPFILLGLYAFLKITERHSGSSYLYISLSALPLGLAMGSDLLSLFWILSIFIALLYHNRKSPARVKVNTIAVFLPVAYLGFFIASPMYTLSFTKAAVSILGNLAFWNSLKGFLWLGYVVEKIPANFYFVVSLVKFTPLVVLIGFFTITLCVVKRKTCHPFVRFLFLCLWPLLFLSFKAHKSPYYLIPFVPVFYILVTYGLVRLFKTRIFAPNRILKILLISLIVATQVWFIAWIHPDYLMLGIQYGDKLYGEFQGPAVSHAQWTGDAMRFVRKDAEGKDPYVLIFDDIGVPQIRYYAIKYKLHNITNKVPDKSALHPSPRIDYIILNQDAKRMIAPLHKNTMIKNMELVSYVENSKEYELLKTFSSGDFPMVWVYKRK